MDFQLPNQVISKKKHSSLYIALTVNSKASKSTLNNNDDEKILALVNASYSNIS